MPVVCTVLLAVKELKVVANILGSVRAPGRVCGCGVALDLGRRVTGILPVLPTNIQSNRTNTKTNVGTHEHKQCAWDISGEFILPAKN